MAELIFVETDVDELETSSKTILEGILGRTLAAADPLWLFTKSLLAVIIQQRALINHAAQQNLLRYATGENLDALGELVGVERFSESRATCTMQLTLSTARSKETVIKTGTRFTSADNVHFMLREDLIFLAGETVKTATAVCIDAGAVGNDYDVGTICNIVDYQPYLSKAVNLTASEGGADVEDDEDLRNRIRLAPSSFSVAGSRQAYEFWAKAAHNLISDVYVNSPVPGYVDVYLLLENGQLPHEEIINYVQEYLSAETIRPLTDIVTVKSAEIIYYDIDLKFWINRNDATQALSIKTAAEKAVDDFIKWQAKKLGRDINSTELFFRLRQAGVKRAEIISPQFTVTPPNAVAVVQNVNIEYKGLEDE